MQSCADVSSEVSFESYLPSYSTYAVGIDRYTMLGTSPSFVGCVSKLGSGGWAGISSQQTG